LTVGHIFGVHSESVSVSLTAGRYGQKRQELFERNKSCLHKLLTHIFSKTVAYTCDIEVVDEDVYTTGVSRSPHE